MASLKRDQSIIILPADKGGVTVVLYRDTYIQKAEQQLSDETTYKFLQCDPTAKQVKCSADEISYPLTKKSDLT